MVRVLLSRFESDATYCISRPDGVRAGNRLARQRLECGELAPAFGCLGTP